MVSVWSIGVNEHGELYMALHSYYAEVEAKIS